MMIYVPLALITDNPYQARVEYGDVAELAADIARHQPTRPDTYGLQQVPTGRVVSYIAGAGGTVLTADELTPLLDDGRLLEDDLNVVVQLEFGHRRFRAFQQLVDDGVQPYAADQLMPVYIRPLTDQQMLDGVWSENHARQDLSAVEQAALLRHKLEACNSQREVAEAWGLARSTVANRLRLLDLSADIQEANRSGRLSERQCLALASVLDIQAAAGPAAENLSWLTDPADYIQEALTGEEQFTSIEIRNYAKSLSRQVGRTLPGVIADAYLGDADTAGDMRQAYYCKGCDKRWQDYCFDYDCLELKKVAFGAVVAKNAAAELGLPYSDDEEHFPGGYEASAELAALYQSTPCEHLVVGWEARGWGFRPFADNPHSFMSGPEVYNQRAGVVIGHVGPLCAAVDASDITNPGEALPPHHELLPNQLQITAWAESERQRCQDLAKQTRATLAEFLDPVALHPLVYLANPAWASMPAEKQVALLLEFLWDRGRAIRWEERDNSAALREAASRVLAPHDLPGDGPAEQATANAVRCLAAWYRGIRPYTYARMNKDEQAAVRYLLNLDTETGRLLDPELSAAVDVARRDIEWWLNHHDHPQKDVFLSPTPAASGPPAAVVTGETP